MGFYDGFHIGRPSYTTDPELSDIAALTPTDGSFIVGDGSDFVSESGATARTSLGLGTIATQAANSVSISGGSITGITDLTVADGGTGSSTAEAARTALGLAIGTNVQAYDATLTSFAGLGTAADKLAYTTGVDTWAETAVTAFARTLLDDADQATAQTTLGVDPAGTDNSTNVTLAADADTLLGISGQALSLDTQSANLVFAGPGSGPAADPTFRSLVAADVPDLSATYQPLDADLTAIAALSSADSNFVVGSAGGWVAESGATARTSLGLGTDDTPTFTRLNTSRTATDAGAIYGINPTITHRATAATAIYSIGFESTQLSYVDSGISNAGYVSGVHAYGAVNTASHQGTFASGYGIRALAGISSCGVGGTVTNAVALYGAVRSADADGTVTSGYGIYVDVPTITGAFASAYGGMIKAQTGASSTNVGFAVEAATTQTLWVSSNANNTTAPAGVAFGSSRDTNLYRSAVDTLKTDDAFVAASLTLTTDLAVTEGGTGASDASTARTNLGLAIGTNVQAYDATLTSFAGLGTAADKLAYTTGVDTWAETGLTAFARTVLDDADAATARTTLGAQASNASMNVGNSGTVTFPDADGSNSFSLAANATTTATVAYTWPAADGNAGDVLTDAAGDGILSWAAAGGGASALDGLSDAATVTAGTGNFIIGHEGTSIQAGALYNLAVGTTAGDAITDGDYNVLVGYEAGGAVTTGRFNTAVGTWAGTTGTSMNYNTFLGYSAGYATTTGGYNTFVGFNAGATNGTGAYNTTIGASAGQALSSGNNNVFCGFEAGLLQTTAADNTGIGYRALQAATTGNGGNTCVGSNAGLSITTGIYNVAIGRAALDALVSNSNNVAVGDGALGACTSSNATAVGYQAGRDSTSSGVTAVGYQAGAAITTGIGNTCVGSNALDGATTATNSCAFGTNALSGNVTASELCAFGRDALLNNTSGVENAAFGYRALASLTTGYNSTAFGHQALASMTTTNSNTAVGRSSLYAATGSANTAVGNYSGAAVTSGSYNVIVGASATTLTTGSGNVIVGPGLNVDVASRAETVTVGRGLTTAAEDGAVAIGSTNVAGNIIRVASGVLTVGGNGIPHTVTAGITASTTQTQGQQPLTAQLNEVSVVANTNDVVTLPAAVVGRVGTVINNGANTLQIFPASGDNLGAGVDTSTTLASGSNVTFAAYNATNWESI